MSELSEIHGANPSKYVVVHTADNIVSFQVQHGPIKELGVNGCQIDELVRFARQTIAAFQKRLPCRENALVLTKLDEAIHWLDHRTADPEARAVEGKPLA